jgi:hypothetical protein
MFWFESEPHVLIAVDLLRHALPICSENIISTKKICAGTMIEISKGFAMYNYAPKAVSKRSRSSQKEVQLYIKTETCSSKIKIKSALLIRDRLLILMTNQLFPYYQSVKLEKVDGGMVGICAEWI